MGKPSPKLTGGPLIAARLEELERSNTWLAKAVGVSDGTVSRWISEERDVSSEYLFPVADALDVDARDLVISAKRTGTEG